MLGIPDETMRQIAQMPTEHSWLAERIVESPDLDELEEKLWAWLKPKAMSLMKDKKNDHSNVWRIVREAYVLVQEKAAIAEFLDQNPSWIGYLPDIYWPEEATDLVSRDLNWISDDEVDEATEVLKQLLPEVMPPSQPASSDSQS